jgi:anti-anti-sigma factor
MPECKLAFHVQRRPDVLLVAMKGEASFDQSDVLSAHLFRILVEARALVVLDLAELTFISSLAMRDLVEFRRGLCRRGVDLRVANVPAQIWTALEAAGLGKSFELIAREEPTRPAASAGGIALT